MLRVAVVCSDASMLRAAVEHLLSLGFSPHACPTLTELAGFAESADAVIVFADGIDRASLVHQLDTLERWRSGPAFIVVSDADLPWKPTLPRERPAIRVPLAFLEWPLPEIAEASMPELPFTD